MMPTTTRTIRRLRAERDKWREQHRTALRLCAEQAASLGVCRRDLEKLMRERERERDALVAVLARTMIASCTERQVGDVLRMIMGQLET